MRLSSKGRALALGSFFAASSLPACRQDYGPKVPDNVPVLEYLRTEPYGTSERLGEPGSPVLGEITECRGKPDCALPVYPGHILLSIRVQPEYGMNMEISFASVETDGIMLKRTIGYFSGGGAVVSFQKLEFGQGGRLFNTDLVGTAERQPGGGITLSIGR